MSKQVGIASFGFALPEYKIEIAEIAKANGRTLDQVSSLGFVSKTVAAANEDTLTLSVAAGLQCLGNQNQISREEIRACFIGSETHPYAVNPTSSAVNQLLNLNPQSFVADLQFACKGGTAACQIVQSLIKSEEITAGLAIGSDKGKGAPSDALEYTAASGAAAFLWSNKNLIAELKFTHSYTENHPDFWRNEGENYPRHAGRFSSSAYDYILGENIRISLAKSNYKISDFDQIILHAPNLKLPTRLAKKLNISKEQLTSMLITSEIGNTYAANALISLCHALETSQPGAKILCASYGSGSGSDLLVLETTATITDFQPQQTIENELAKLTTINYEQYYQLKENH